MHHLVELTMGKPSTRRYYDWLTDQHGRRGLSRRAPDHQPTPPPPRRHDHDQETALDWLGPIVDQETRDLDGEW